MMTRVRKLAQLCNSRDPTVQTRLTQVPVQRLIIELYLKRLFGLHVTWCTQMYSLAETPEPFPHPSPRIWTRTVYPEGVIGQPISLWPPQVLLEILKSVLMRNHEAEFFYSLWMEDSTKYYRPRWDSPTQASVPSPPDQRVGGGGVGEFQFRRLKNKLNTLPTLWSIERKTTRVRCPFFSLWYSHWQDSTQEFW